MGSKGLIGSRGLMGSKGLINTQGKTSGKWSIQNKSLFIDGQPV